MTARLRVMAEPTRVRLMWLLDEHGAATVQELQDRLPPTTHQNVSRHLGVLHQTGLVTRVREGNCVRYEVRDVEMTPDLVEAVIEHIDQLRRAGCQTGPGDPLVPNLNGGRISRQRVGEILREAAQAASEERVAAGLPPLPAVTPHSMRRTYISLALVANNFDVKWVMRQVGHANSKMTLDVYAQLEQRIKRDHGASLDRLISAARTRPDDEPAPARPEAVALEAV